MGKKGLKLEYSEDTTCAVTHHFVEDISLEQPELFRTAKGELKLYEVLFHLGFNINWNMINKNVSVHKDILIRSNEDHEKCYKTTVYKGWVRNEVKCVTYDQFNKPTIVYDKTEFHHLLPEYNKYEVLQPVNLGKYVSNEELLWVKDFGGGSKLSECIIEEI